MEIFFITLGAFGAFIFVMAIGVIIGNRRIQGSCGGPDGCNLCGAGGEVLSQRIRRPLVGRGV